MNRTWASHAKWRQAPHPHTPTATTRAPHLPLWAACLAAHNPEEGALQHVLWVVRARVGEARVVFGEELLDPEQPRLLDEKTRFLLELGSRASVRVHKHGLYTMHGLFSASYAYRRMRD